MATPSLEAYKHISPSSGYPTTVHPHFNPAIAAHVPRDAPHVKFTPPKDRAFYADPEKKALLEVAKAVELTESIGEEVLMFDVELGTVLENVQLGGLNDKQLDELAALVNERAVVFFRGQELGTERQVEIFEYLGVLDKHPSQKVPPLLFFLHGGRVEEEGDVKHVTIRGSSADWRELEKYTPWPQADFHADTSFEINPPSYSLLRMEEHPAVGGDTAWVSQYGLYDELSPHMKKFVEGLHAVHTSRLQYDTIIDSWGAAPNRPPIDTHHPAVRTHPVTGLRALNVNLGFVTGFAELKKAESDALLQFSRLHIHSAGDHYVRWKWEVGSIAMWDNRTAIHRVIPGKYTQGTRRGIRTTVFGEKPYFDPKSESREERKERLARESANIDVGKNEKKSPGLENPNHNLKTALNAVELASGEKEDNNDKESFVLKRCRT
ncbi:putative alpha-ketoglutarate-dependent sulfonate dioxygenase [Lachnellula suecica]|uniref:Putative alpha-ketoglutarate-dependent sulfonate dioxygenase n=1 Tax=Lachnellula suecica TaxID=602035 RepID=A0A8T9CG29_9HELO|nr:putative alpha-ketoglutarate-dependent sulfonate dioxygenase [Lachnellula suecica]